MNLTKGTIQGLIWLLLLLPLAGYGQEILMPRAFENGSVGIVYDREVSFPFTLHTNGWSFGINQGKLKTYYKTSFWGLSIGQLTHPRETRIADRAVQFGQGSSSFVFGRQSSMFPLKAHKGWKRYYSGKDKRRGVAVGTSFEVGATAGIVKPYVLQISNSGPDVFPLSSFYTYEENPDGFATRGRIEGSGGLRRGWSQASIIPGVNARAAIHLDWGAFDELMKAVEAGIMVDVFAREVPLLIPPSNNTPLFINFYVSLHLGKRR